MLLPTQSPPTSVLLSVKKKKKKFSTQKAKKKINGRTVMKKINNDWEKKSCFPLRESNPGRLGESQES